MANSSSEGGSGEGGGRRYPRNLEGVLRFATENTVTEDAPGPSSATLTQMDPERNPNPTSSHGISRNNVVGVADMPNDPELARVNQDKALEVLGLHRYRIAGDGNCLFRAIAWQLKFDQVKYHPILRNAAVKWMKENKDELLEWGLLDSEKEIDETSELGVWPGQASIVALANIFHVNIAVIQGGDKGDIDIQHICPFETATAANGEQGSIILAYLYNGHYDAIVEQPNVANPEFEAWTLRRNKAQEADEALAWKLAAEEGYNGSTSQPIIKDMSKECEGDEALARRLMEEEFNNGLVSSHPVTDLIQHVSDVQVSAQTKPLELNPKMLENPLVIHTAPTCVLQSPLQNARTSPPNKPPPRAQPQTIIRTNIPDRPTRPPPRRTASEDIPDKLEENRMRLTLYPKKQMSLEEEFESKRVLYKPVLNTAETQMHVTRKPVMETDPVMERRMKEAANPPVAARTRSPSIRVIPIQFVGRTPQPHAQSTQAKVDSVARIDLDRRSAVRRRDTTSQLTSPESEFYASNADRPIQCIHSPDKSPAGRPLHLHGTPRTSYTLVNDPARPQQRSPVTQHHIHSHADHNLNLTQPHPSSTASRRSPTIREVPVMVLSARSPQPSSTMRARATPAPATYDLNKAFDMPASLKPYRSALDNSEYELMLRRNYWS